MDLASKEALKAARQRAQPKENAAKATGPSGGHMKTTTKGPSAPRFPTEKPVAEKPRGKRPRGEAEESPRHKHHKSSSRKEKEKEKEKLKEKGKAPATAAPQSEPIDVDAADMSTPFLETPALRALFHQFTNSMDIEGSLGSTIGEIEDGILEGIAKISCASRHYIALLPKFYKQQKEVDRLNLSVDRLDAEKALLTAEKAKLEEDLKARSEELRKEKEISEERRRKWMDSEQHSEDQRLRLQAVEDSIVPGQKKAVADYLGSAEYKEARAVQATAMLESILHSAQRRLAKQCPGLNTDFLYGESDEETEMTGAAPEAEAAGAEAEAEVTGAAAGGTVLEEGEVGQVLERLPTPPTPHCDMP